MKTEIKSILLIYRENDSFDHFVPKLEEVLKSSGYVVETKKFPKGTEKFDIEKWWRENPTKTGVQVLSDKTCYKMRPYGANGGVSISFSLDTVFDFFCPCLVFLGEEIFSKFIRQDKEGVCDI